MKVSVYRPVRPRVRRLLNVLRDAVDEWGEAHITEAELVARTGDAPSTVRLAIREACRDHGLEKRRVGNGEGHHNVFGLGYVAPAR
jgi:hypothetical protein